MKNDRIRQRAIGLALAVISAFCLPSSAFSFEGRLTATCARGGETQTWLYTVGPSQLRLERAETNWPHAWNLVARDTGALTLVFPHNRSFVRLKPVADTATPPDLNALPQTTGQSRPEGKAPFVPSAPFPLPLKGEGQGEGVVGPAPPPMPPLPPGVGPQSGAGFGALPMMPMPMEPPLELKATGQTTNLLGYACARYELKQRGETLEIWATDKLLPFQPWQPNQRPRFGPRMIEEQWGDLLRAQKLFPMLAVLKLEHSPERLRFEVKSVTEEKITDPDGNRFQPPADYHEVQPLPF